MIKSPCINVCEIDPKSGLCKGCLRTSLEISNWPVTTNEQKWWILDDIALVRAEVYKFEVAKTP